MQRFLDKINKQPDGCWIWTGCLRGKTGYGAIKINKKTFDTHRISWQLHKGEIPEGLDVCHTCDVRNCVNPDHLFLGTRSDNMRDAYQKGRLPHLSDLCFKKGEAPPNRAVTDGTAREIKLHIAAGDRSVDIAKRFGVSKNVVSNIKTGRYYTAA